nr:S1/P1 nuclease [Bradyrhizobium genosp. SA-3]
MRVFAILFIGMIALTDRAFAWGDEGHQIVCEIAYRLATVDTRAAIRKLVRNDQEYDTFSEACIYPDHPHRRAPEHFVNLPRTAHELPPEGCPGENPCVLSAIENDSTILGSKGKPADRLIALKFLGHWVGDIHQPLHVSFADDKGGNGIDVSGLCSGVLHATWDTCLVMKAVGKDVDAAASDLIDTLTPAMKGNGSNPSPATGPMNPSPSPKPSRRITAPCKGGHARKSRARRSRLMRPISRPTHPSCESAS